MRSSTSLQGMLIMLLVAGTAVVLWSLLSNRSSGTGQDHFVETSRLLGLRQAEVRLDRDLQRIASLRVHHYDHLVADMALLEEGIRTTRDHEIEGGERYLRYLDALEIWLDSLENKLNLANKIVSRSAALRNDLRYLDTLIGDERAADSEIRDLINDMFSYFVFGSSLRHQDILEDLEEVRALAQENDLDLDRELANIRDLLHRTNDLLGVMARYQAIDSRALFEEAYRFLNLHQEAQLQSMEERRQLLVVLALFLMASLAWSYWRLEQGRVLAESAHRRLRDAVASIDEGFALTDSGGRVLMYNESFLDCYPWLRGHLDEGTPLHEILRCNERHGVRRTPLTGRPSSLANGHRSHRTFLEEFTVEGGERRWLLATDIVTGAGENVLSRVDITDHKQQEIRLAVLHRAVEQSPVSVIITDAERRIEYVNPTFERITGYKRSEVEGKNPRFLKSGRTPESTYRSMWQSIENGKIWHGRLVNRRRDGTTYWEENTIAPVRDSAGCTTHYIAFKIDVTDRKESEELLQLHATVFVNLAEGVIITDADERVVAVNPAFNRITGRFPEDVVGKPVGLLRSSHHDESFYCALRNELRQQGRWEGEITDCKRDGTPYPAWTSIIHVSGAEKGAGHYILVFDDISERKAAEEFIRRQANYDALTGLPNRNLFTNQLDHALQVAKREEWNLALMFVDLDHFKEVNDTLGHLAGDMLIKEVAERLLSCVRDTDTVARFGGDEFVILLEGISQMIDASRIARKILDILAVPMEIQGNRLFIGASIGITVYPGDADDVVSLLRNADIAMYRAKEAGRNTFQFYTEEMNRKLNERVRMVVDMRRALNEGEFSLVYQPIVRFQDRKVEGFEALVRWQHPTRGLILPSEFIPIAEETGLIEPLGEQVLRLALQETRQWQDANREWRICVNISSRQLGQGLTVARIRQLLEESGVDPQRLTLEVTEGLILNHSRETMEWICGIREMGCQIAIDDFGTGYSSLSYIKRYPLDLLKIDRSFVSDIDTEGGDTSLVQTILAMARSLGLKVVAEGIEQEAQLRFLMAHGCNFGQGYFFSHPVTARELETGMNPVAGEEKEWPEPFEVPCSGG